MTATPTRHRYARLSYEDGEIVVTPRDRDIFLISAEKATEACRQVLQLNERIKRFENEILIPLNEWCLKHVACVKACYISVPGNHLQVFIVTKSSNFDLGLGAEIAELELALARQHWRVGTSQLPAADEASLATFFNPDGAIEVYAERRSASDESGE